MTRVAASSPATLGAFNLVAGTIAVPTHGKCMEMVYWGDNKSSERIDIQNNMNQYLLQSILWNTKTDIVLPATVKLINRFRKLGIFFDAKQFGIIID